VDLLAWEDVLGGRPVPLVVLEAGRDLQGVDVASSSLAFLASYQGMAFLVASSLDHPPLQVLGVSLLMAFPVDQT